MSTAHVGSASGSGFQRSALDLAMIDFCSELFRLRADLRVAQRSVEGWQGDIPRDLLDLAPFSRILRAYDAFLATSGTAAGDRLILDLLRQHDSIFAGSSYFYLGEIILGYLDLRPDQRELAAERSDELMAMKPSADLDVHLLVWRSSLPVVFLHSELNSFSVGSNLIPYELAAFRNGHDSRIQREFGIWAPMLLSSDELEEATALIQSNNPGVKLTVLSKLAQLKESAMTAKIFLELLRLGYGSAAQVRRAGELAATSARSRDYFDRILAGGATLASDSR